MIMYSKLETVKIFKECATSKEVAKAARAFGWLKREHFEVPHYVIQIANLRMRSLL